MRRLIEALRRWLFPGYDAPLYGVILMFASLTPACAGAQDAACSPVSLRAVELAHTEAALAVVESGQCDGYEVVDDCPAYQAVSAYFEPGYTAWKICK